MEAVIDRLLKDFEAGKLTRRQLIKSLAVVAVAAIPVSATAQRKAIIPPPRNPAPWKTVWLDHISYAVSDYRKSAAFYRDLMGWEIRHDDGRHQCSMTIGTIGGIIIRNNSQAAGGAQARLTPGQPRITGVINHVSWGIDPWDTATVKAELDRRGLDPRADMVGKNFKSFHVTDPDGWDLQISNQRDANEL